MKVFRRGRERDKLDRWNSRSVFRCCGEEFEFCLVGGEGYELVFF